MLHPRPTHRKGHNTKVTPGGNTEGKKTQMEFSQFERREGKLDLKLIRQNAADLDDVKQCHTNTKGHQNKQQNAFKRKYYSAESEKQYEKPKCFRRSLQEGCKITDSHQVDNKLQLKTKGKLVHNYRNYCFLLTKVCWY